MPSQNGRWDQGDYIKAIQEGDWQVQGEALETIQRHRLWSTWKKANGEKYHSLDEFVLDACANAKSLKSSAFRKRMRLVRNRRFEKLRGLKVSHVRGQMGSKNQIISIKLSEELLNLELEDPAFIILVDMLIIGFTENDIKKILNTEDKVSVAINTIREELSNDEIRKKILALKSIRSLL